MLGCECRQSGAREPCGRQSVRGYALLCGADGEAAMDFFGDTDLELAVDSRVAGPRHLEDIV